jgi:hypothetical protein
MGPGEGIPGRKLNPVPPRPSFGGLPRSLSLMPVGIEELMLLGQD